MQNAIDEVATMVNGIVVNVTANSWDIQEDGTYKKIIALEQITGTESFDVCLDPSTQHTEEQIRAFGELVSSIETAEGMIILTAIEEITVSFKIFLHGQINFGKGNLVALSENVIEITEITKADFEKLSDADKANGCYYIPDGDGLDLSAKNMEYDGSVTGLGNTVQDAIDNMAINAYNALTAGDLTFKFATDGEGTYGYLGADGSLIPFKSGGDYSFVECKEIFYCNDGTDISSFVLSKGEYLLIFTGCSTGYANGTQLINNSATISSSQAIITQLSSATIDYATGDYGRYRAKGANIYKVVISENSATISVTPCRKDTVGIIHAHILKNSNQLKTNGLFKLQK